MKKYMIIPDCSDLNRGDQALVWETKRLMEESGYIGQYYLTTEKNEPVQQSVDQGLKIVTPILEHPSRKFHSKSNITYSKVLKFKWGVVALGDFIFSLLLLFKPTRKVLRNFLSEEKKESLSIMEECDAIFLKGGGLLQTYGGFSSTYSMYFWTYPIFLASSLKKKILIMPNSFGPFEGPMVKKIAKSALKKCALVTARESYSKAMVQSELKLTIESFPDLAFSLNESNLSRKDIFSKFNLTTIRKNVAITMRPYRFPNSSDPEKAYVTFKKEMAKLIEWLYSEGYMPVLIVHTRAINDHENDSACINDVIKNISREKYRIIDESSYNCKDLKSIYSNCDYIIGTRFHSVIFSLASGVPGIAIAYTGNKSQGIMHDIGLDEYVIKIDKVSQAKLSEMFIRLIKDEENVTKKINDYKINVVQKRLKLISLCQNNFQ